ncbi:hypothetical protein GCM10010168_52470 [Actinoplanes ianthinogenes]|uniref:Histidine kinase/HSP90-like ATPase domain-containing protein n=1 Tax=Actinoplanes ianthinogenes TaxID=122358 RepID=A0ABN6CMK6_9ACTN|nr:hypothetical protein [Actinoplanes ianthinogenes]BCJ46296.1 hypothetical protein Aiant_69530 [Actinoplanes ianthinogenes]GGR27661.1 hypothetical protein GCM10010168_52470 [Actinoplanes ianthinogenes]
MPVPLIDELPFDLAELVRSTLAAHRAEADEHDVVLLHAIAPAVALGHPELAGHLVTSLVENAIRSTEPTGWAGVTVRSDALRAVLTVVNTGPATAGDQVPAMASRSGAIVTVTPRPEGGLVVEAAFPAARHVADRRRAPLSPRSEPGTETPAQW